MSYQDIKPFLVKWIGGLQPQIIQWSGYKPKGIMQWPYEIGSLHYEKLMPAQRP